MNDQHPIKEDLPAKESPCSRLERSWVFLNGAHAAGEAVTCSQPAGLLEKHASALKQFPRDLGVEFTCHAGAAKVAFAGHGLIGREA